MTTLSIDSILSLHEDDRQSFLQELSEKEAGQFLYDWSAWARDKQMPPEGDWLLWELFWGRGAGKTRTGSEGVRMRVESGVARRIALVG